MLTESSSLLLLLLLSCFVFTTTHAYLSCTSSLVPKTPFVAVAVAARRRTKNNMHFHNNNNNNIIKKENEFLFSSDTYLSASSSSASPSTSVSASVSSSSKTLFSRYHDCLTKYPLPTQMVSSAVVGGLGDVMVQAFDGWKKHSSLVDIQWQRLLIFTLVSGTYIAPIIGQWFRLLTSLLGGIKTKWKRALSMMLVDQTFGAVFINMGFFYAFAVIQNIVTQKKISTELIILALAAGHNSAKKNMWATLVANWYCWPLINFINFMFVPPSYRLLFSNVAALFWNMFLSSIANS